MITVSLALHGDESQTQDLWPANCSSEGESRFTQMTQSTSFALLIFFVVSCVIMSVGIEIFIVLHIYCQVFHFLLLVGMKSFSSAGSLQTSEPLLRKSTGFSPICVCRARKM